MTATGGGGEGKHDMLKGSVPKITWKKGILLLVTHGPALKRM